MFILQKNAEEKEETQCTIPLFLSLSSFYLTETVHPTIFPNRSKSVVIAILIQTSLSGPLGLFGVTVT